MAEADRRLRLWEQECVDKIVREDDGEYRLDRFPEIPPIMSVIVSDAVHNLRAALDYLVYELTLWDSYGYVEDGTQFPIEDFKIHPVRRDRGFDARRKRDLKGLNDGHAAAIETLQPYKGVEWTETLRNISNPDKHRHLHVFTKDGRQVGVRVLWRPDGRFVQDSVNVETKEIVPVRFDVKVDANETIAITLPKRGEVSVFPTLRRLEAEVCRVLEAFKPEFQI